MTTICLDDAVVAEAKRLTGIESDSDAVDTALRLHIQLQRQAEAGRALRGSFQWQGNLEESRLSRFVSE